MLLFPFSFLLIPCFLFLATADWNTDEEFKELFDVSFVDDDESGGGGEDGEFSPLSSSSGKDLFTA